MRGAGILHGDLTGAGRKQKAVVSFISDDGRVEDYTVLKPLFQKKSLPCCSAIITGRIGAPGYMTGEQIEQLHQAGWEIASHSASHADFTKLKKSQIIKELSTSKEALNNMGYQADSFAFPFGALDGRSMRLARHYYRCAFSFSHTKVNLPPYNRFSIYRIALGAFFSNPNPAYPITSTFADYYKRMVDETVWQKAWLVITLHPAATSSIQWDYLEQTIDYINALGIPVKNPAQVLNGSGSPAIGAGHSHFMCKENIT